MNWFWCDLSLSHWPASFLQCFDAVGWVVWLVKIVSKITYNVSWDVKLLLSHPERALNSFCGVCLEQSTIASVGKGKDGLLFLVHKLIYFQDLTGIMRLIAGRRPSFLSACQLYFCFQAVKLEKIGEEEAVEEEEEDIEAIIAEEFAVRCIL